MPYSKRRCTGSPTCPALLTKGERYCPTHQAQYEQRRGTAWSRGYNKTHRELKKQWQHRINQGEPITCACTQCDCTTPITGTTWDLGHTTDRTDWTGPECHRCNRGHAGQRSLAGRR